MRFRDAFLAGDERAAALLAPTFLDERERCRAVARAHRALAPDVRAALVAANTDRSPGEARARALAALDDEVSFVVTGQQVGLFGGPLYSLHKAASAIALARRLSSESGRVVLPVFWLQTEDHDVDEVAGALLVDRAGTAHTATINTRGAYRCSMAARTLDDTIEDALDTAREALASLPHGADVTAMLGAHWRPGRRQVDAFADTVRAMFADTELLVFDPRTPALSELAAPIHRRAILEHDAIAAALRQRSCALSDAGFGDQVPLRPDCALSCFHPQGADGGRYRLRSTDDGWEAAGHGARLNTPALLAAIDADPMCVSSTALLRPLVQDTLLPVAAYVGGPAEVAYFAQLAPLYAIFDVALPMIVPRPTWRWVPRDVRAVLDHHGLGAADLDHGVDAAIDAARDGDAAGPGDQASARLLAALDAELQAITADLPDADGEIARASRRTRNTMARYAGRFGERIDRAHARSDRARLANLETAAAWLAPNGVSAERTICPPSFAALVGTGVLVARAIGVADPLVPPPPEVDL